MGFPVAYTDIFMPPLFLFTLTYLTTFRNLLISLFSSLGLAIPDPNPAQPQAQTRELFPDPGRPALTRELLQVIKLSEVEEREDSTTTTSCCCSVCLYEVCGDHEIRWLDNCRHVFHRECIDRWIEHDHHTCPLCRAPLVRLDLVRGLQHPRRRMLSAFVVEDEYDNDHDHVVVGQYVVDDHHFIY